ncbi:hypothetical protein BDV98DRAFT_337608 [Pterulicium gracile]|uniref:Uncharacterized protein n=1 Tax=Pterulicium gracile TaxID=1884261 RepID=A0A5C3Q5H8_9AGAR|nr:hypothetical protein BDV98DRAFT_337608 [Pterula gracilis]
MTPITYDPTYGALSPLWAATSQETANLNGEASYLVPWGMVGRALGESKDPALGKKLWDWCKANIQP